MKLDIIDLYRRNWAYLFQFVLFILTVGIYGAINHNAFNVELTFTAILILFYIKSFWNKKICILNTIWIIGNFLSWIFFYVLLRYSFSGISELDFLRPYLFNVYLIGITVSNLLFSGFSQEKVVIKIQKSDILMISSVLVLILYILASGLNSRELGYGFATEFNSFYFVQAFLFLFYLVSLTAGYYFGLNTYTLLFATILAVNFIGEHRGELIANSLFFMVGLFLNYRQPVVIKYGISILVITGISVAFLSIGENRLQKVGMQELSSLEFNLQRIVEPSGQVVIDEVYITGNYDGFENFSRILTMPIPSFLLNGKPNNDDSNEVLNEKFGYHDLGEMTSIPIPFIADAFRRFGAVGVFVLSLVISLLFNIISIALLSSEKSWALPLYLITGLYAIKIYPSSVLGTISFFMYVLLKFYLILRFLYSGFSLKSIYLKVRKI